MASSELPLHPAMHRAGNGAPPSTLAALPNEVFTLILEFLPTTHLLPLLGVDTRFYSTTRAILLRRLRDLSSPATDLILECFDDRDRLSAPSLSCRYLETTSPTTYPTHSVEAEDPGYSPLWWHTWFEIGRRGDVRCPRPRHTTPTRPLEDAGGDEEAPTKDVSIEEGVPDVSLTFRALIEAEGPATFPTHVVLWEQVLAVSREWFERAAAARDEATDGGDCSGDSRILWFGPERNCGLRARVRSLEAETPVLVEVGGQPAVSYRMEYDALIMRSMIPLVAVDRTFIETFAADEGAMVVVPIAQ